MCLWILSNAMFFFAFDDTTIGKEGMSWCGGREGGNEKGMVYAGS
jgi:hypothetical protein